MAEQEFRVNEFKIYEVKVEGLSLGFIDAGGGGYNPAKGEKITYDGNTAVLEDGREFKDVPQLRTAVKREWLVLVGDKVSHPRPKAAGVKVRPTQTVGFERVIKTTVETHFSDEREVISVVDRRKSREATNEKAAQRVPLESQEAQDAVAAASSVFTGDDAVDEMLGDLDTDLALWGAVEKQPHEPEEVEGGFEAEVESDITDLLDWVESDNTPVPAPVSASFSAPRTARNLPVDMQDDRVTMPLVREDPTENAGTVVGNVGDQKRTVIEREEEIALDVAQAKPRNQSPAPKPRFGGAGALVVDEQRDMGTIALSSSSAPIKLHESAKVSAGSRESIQMGKAEVGRKTASKAPSTSVDGGVAVGRVLSPTKTSFVANDANTSSSAIQRAQEGKRLKVERYETDEEVVGSAIATGDVQEARSGDTLEEALPNAATAGKPEVYRRPEDDPAYKAVKMLIPDFEWNKDRPVKERVAEAIKHVKNPQYVKGILAVETATCSEEIKKAIAAEIKRLKSAKKPQKDAEEPEKASEEAE